MYGPHRDTRLKSQDYELLLRALEYEIGRLAREVVTHRDAYDRPAWAHAYHAKQKARALWNQLRDDLSTLRPLSENERRWNDEHLISLQSSMPRSAANAVAFRADMEKRKVALEARRASHRADRSRTRRMRGVPDIGAGA